MKKFVTLAMIATLMTSCDGFTKSKTIAELTSQLEVENAAKVKLVSSNYDIKFKQDVALESHKAAQGNIVAKPAIAKSVAYILDDRGYINAFDLNNKKKLWNTKLEVDDQGFNYDSGGVLYSNDMLYITNGSKSLIAIDAETGIEKFRKTFHDSIRHPAIMVGDNIVVVQTNDNQLIAYNISNFQTEWISSGNPGAISSKNHFSPMNIDDNVLVSYSSGELVMISGKNGEIKWLNNLGKDDLTSNAPGYDTAVLISKPIVTKQYIYAATSNSQILKINIDTGKVSWRKNVDNIHSMTISGDNLIVANSRQAVILSSNNGNIKWVADLQFGKKDKTTPEFLTPFVVHDIYNKQYMNIISSEAKMHQFSVDANGQPSSDSLILNIPKQVAYYWISCCDNKIYMFNNNMVSF